METDPFIKPKAGFEEQKDSAAPKEKEESIEKGAFNHATEEIKKTDLEADTLPEEARPLPTMEDVEKLEKGGSVAAFLVKGVSSEIKKAALSKLFQGAEFNIVDGLDDYDLDYSNPKKLSAQMLAGLRHWTQEKAEDIQEKTVEACVRTIEEKTNVKTAASLPETSPDLSMKNEVKESETKSTHDKEEDILSVQTSQYVPFNLKDKNVDGS